MTPEERIKAALSFKEPDRVPVIIGVSNATGIEIGVDILNPIQTSAGKMSDLSGLKEKYGDRIVFCGGIDTQKRGQKSFRNTWRRWGYILGSVHTIMNDVPAENILAIVQAVES